MLGFLKKKTIHLKYIGGWQPEHSNLGEKSDVFVKPHAACTDAPKEPVLLWVFSEDCGAAVYTEIRGAPWAFSTAGIEDHIKHAASGFKTVLADRFPLTTLL